MNTLDTIVLAAKRLRWTLGQCAAALMLSACASQPSIAMKTLDGHPPLIIAHRGLPGLYPEEVIAGYRAAIAAGTDALELDLQSSSDGVLFACHNVFLGDTTDVASHPEFALRKKSRLVDGVTKLSKLDFYSAEDRQAESFRKMLLAMVEDIRVILVKLAMATREFVPLRTSTQALADSLDRVTETVDPDGTLRRALQTTAS